MQVGSPLEECLSETNGPDGLDLWFRRTSAGWVRKHYLVVIIPLLLLTIHTKFQMDYMAKYGYAAKLNGMGGCVLFVHHWTDDMLPVLLDIIIPLSFILLPAYCVSCLSKCIPGVELIGGKSETQFFRRLTWLSTRTIMPGVFAVVMSAILVWETQLIQIDRLFLFTDYLPLLIGASVISLPLSALLSWMIATVSVRMHGTRPFSTYLAIMLLLLPFFVPMLLDVSTNHRITLAVDQSLGLYLVWIFILCGFLAILSLKAPTGFVERLDSMQANG